MVAAPASLSRTRALLKEEHCHAACVSLAQKGHWDRYLALIKHSGSRVHDAIGDGRWRTIHFAAQQGQLVAVRAILAQSGPVNATDAFGNTPLNLAAHGAHWETVHCLLSAGAHAGAASRWTGYGALHYAAHHGAPAAAIDALLASGADARAVSPKESSALALPSPNPNPKRKRLVVRSPLVCTP